MDPYALAPAGTPRGLDGRDAFGPGYDEGTGHFTGPFVMAGINTRIVRRSNALLGFAYGNGFRYDEAVDTGRGPAGLLRAVGLTAGVAGIAVAAAASALPGGGGLVTRFAPAPGEGPTREQRERGSFRVEIHAAAASGERLTGVVGAQRDPGYGATSIMLAESALSLAEDPLPERGGVLTTASCMGMHLVERLRRAGMTFRVEG